ncbi:hypothetical protein BC826DRAFT_1061056 [Russula brevipes]|nr:hypothetical protein BC826DRAFT_1061056 [Russula brevipes]
MTPAHTIVAQACLEVLLHLHENPTEDTLKKLPLAEYAARYWVGHARFENVSPRIEDQMKRLFDPKKPHLSAWVWIYDPIFRSDRFGRSQLPSQVKATPLHYAAVCGLPDVVRFLIVECSQDINARDSQYHETQEHHDLEVSRVLLEYGALNQISREVLEHGVVALAAVAHTLSQYIQLFDGIPLNESIFFASVGSCLRAFLTVPIMLLYSFAFLSNSYTLRRNRAVLFFFIYTLIPPLITALSTRTAHLRYRIFAFSALFLASIMLTGEQHSWCPIMFSRSGAAPLPGIVRVSLIPVAALVPYGMRRALAISQYEKAIITPALISCSTCWLLKWLDACGIYQYPTNVDFDRTGHAVAWASMLTVFGGTALWALVPVSWQRTTHKAAVGVATNAHIHPCCAVIAYFWSFVLVLSAEVFIALANVSLFAYIELADTARDARALRVCFEAEPAGALACLQHGLLMTKVMPLFWVATVMLNLMTVFFISGHRETLVCTHWKAGFVVTPEVSRLSPLLEVFATFVCAAAVALINPLIYTHSRIHSQNMQRIFERLKTDAPDPWVARIRRSQFFATVGGDPLRYNVALLFGIVFSGLWLWRHFMA